MADHPFDTPTTWGDLREALKARTIVQAADADEVRSMTSDSAELFLLEDSRLLYELIEGDETSADSTGTTPAICVSADNYRYARVGQIVGFSPEWTAVAVESNQATIDLDVSDKFEITVDDDCELQVPANASPGRPFAVRVVYSGASHAFTYAAGWEGINPTVLDGDGDETVLTGLVLDTDPSTTAIINQAKLLPAS